RSRGRDPAQGQREPLAPDLLGDWLCGSVLARHIAVGVEHGLDAVDDVRSADQKAGLKVRPVDACKVRTGVVQQLLEVEVLPAYPQQRQCGGNRLADCTARIDGEDGRVQAKHWRLHFPRLEGGVCGKV